MRCSCCKKDVLVGANFCCECGTRINNFIEVPDAVVYSADSFLSDVQKSAALERSMTIHKIQTGMIVASSALDLLDDCEICEEEVTARGISSILMGAISIGSAFFGDGYDSSTSFSALSGAYGVINGAKVIKHRGTDSKLAIVGTSLSALGVVAGLAMKYLK